MKIGIPREVAAGENRVAVTPDAVARLVAGDLEITVESGAGLQANFSDDQYKEAGATIAADAAAAMSGANVVLKIHAPTDDEVAKVPEGAALVALLAPLTSPNLVKKLAQRRITGFSMDTVPRIARAQSMDALSSMSSLAGYKAVLMAAGVLGKYFPMMITAAGTYPPARGLVLGAGVAGLQAIATARRLGAVVQAFDVRAVVKEQVESLGATFIGPPPQEEAEDAGGYARELGEDAQRQQRELIQDHAKDMDFIVCTALIPGRPAPLLVTEDAVKGMKPGSVIIDMAAETGGNCQLTEAGVDTVKHGVHIMGPLNLPSTLPMHASQMYARNISNLLLHLVKDGELALDFEDAITQGCCITHNGEVVHGPTKAALG